MLQVDLRELARGPVETRAELSAEDPLFADMGFALAAPVQVSGRLQATGEGRFYWQGGVRTVVKAECRRCLKELTLPVDAEVGALFSQEPDAQDDPDAYPLPPHAEVVDVTPALREELILAAPRYVECRPDCKGLCPQCGKDWNTGPCDCRPAVDPRWAGLESLKKRVD
jgi:uncharacterized protein